MTNKEEKLCADRDSLTGLADLGDEFIKAMETEAVEFEKLGIDTSDLNVILKEGRKTLKATRKRLKV